MSRKVKVEIDPGHLRMLRGELTKVRCWMTGFGAGRGYSASPISHAGIPGEDGLRQVIMEIDRQLKGVS